MDAVPLIIRESFSLPYHGGDIWCEHLDALADRLDVAEDKFNRDMRTILRPSTSAHIALALYGTNIDLCIADLIVGQFKAAGPKVRRVAIIGASRTGIRSLQTSLKREEPRFAHRFFDDFECGKAWLIP